jgi:hypothetical protein
MRNAGRSASNVLSCNRRTVCPRGKFKRRVVAAGVLDDGVLTLLHVRNACPVGDAAQTLRGRPRDPELTRALIKREEQLRTFFGRYATVSLGPDPEKLAEFYDTSFLAAGPKGGAAFNNDTAFLSWLREVHDFNVHSGMTSLAAGGIEEIPVSADYTLATVAWAATFRKTGDAPIPFSISYLLRLSGAELKVAAYISHEDQEETMRASGLL